MLEDAVGPDRRTGDVFALYAEIYALRLAQDVVELPPGCPVVPPAPTPTVDEHEDAAAAVREHGRSWLRPWR